MKNIAFYISNHGFGHAARNIPIIRALLANEDIKVFIKSGKEQIDFIKQSLEEHLSKVALFHNNVDIGLVLKEGSLALDEEALKSKLLDYINSWDSRIEDEIEFLKENNIDMIVSDVVPWVFKAAFRLNIKSLLISNFTWVEIYKKYFDYEIYNSFLECYKLADKALLYKLYNEDIKSYFRNYEYIGLSCRDFDIKAAENIKKSYDKPIVFVSVGRSVNISDEIMVEGLPYTFIVTEGIKLVGNNVHYLPKETPNTQDYILASEFIITKAGWGTVAEALCADKPMAIIARDFIEEDRNTTDKLCEMGMAIRVSEDEVYKIENIIDKINMFNYNYNNYKFTNDSLSIANNIEIFLRGDFNE